VSLLAVVFICIHVATALIDSYSGVTPLSVLLPFAAHWKPLFVGLGTVSLDLVAAVILTSLLRRRLGLRIWRAVHVSAYLSWPLAVAHSIGTGTDASSTWLRAVALLCVAAVGATFAGRLGREARRSRW
jgi:sulfoxide reductase heme-binding subunit YedZ